MDKEDEELRLSTYDGEFHCEIYGNLMEIALDRIPSFYIDIHIYICMIIRF